MRASTDLLELELVFSQQPPLTPTRFLDEYKRRESGAGSSLIFLEQLEALHRAQVLIPLFRLVKNVRRIWREAEREGISPLSIIFQHLSDHSILNNYLHGYGVGRMTDPRAELFKPWHTYVREYEDHSFQISLFCYSHYQLLLIPTLRRLTRSMRSHKADRKYLSINRRFSLKLDEETRADVERAVISNYEIVFCLTAIETKYLPQIKGTITNHRSNNMESLFKYAQSFDPQRMLEWLGWEADKLRINAENLLSVANRIDPLNEWYQLIRLCRFEKWQRLRGDALIAMDHRIAAEMLLLFYEDLVRAGKATPLEPLPRKLLTPRHKRLQTDRKELSEVLMDFGISPHPALVLVLEGYTEMLLVPRVFDLLELPLQSDLIKLFNAEGVDRKLGALAQYAITPEIGEAISSGFLLTRPPTHFLVVVDPEKGFATPASREEVRKSWVNEIWRAIHSSARSKISVDEINPLVEVDTWNSKGESFEFAHFTDRQIASAILKVYKGPDAPSIKKLAADVKKQRTHAGNIEKLWKRWKGLKPTKVKLADALWPTLKRRINKALAHNTHNKIPVVRIALRAVERADYMLRSDVMIKTI
jgi:hypothetical protein